MKSHSTHHMQELFLLFSLIKDRKEAENLLRDILTPQELDAIGERWQILKELHAGRTQREISEDLKVSIGTITRGSRVLQYGSGIFKVFVDRMKNIL